MNTCAVDERGQVIYPTHVCLYVLCSATKWLTPTIIDTKSGSVSIIKQTNKYVWAGKKIQVMCIIPATRKPTIF